MIDRVKTKNVISNYIEKYYELKKIKEKWLENTIVQNDMFKISRVLNLYIEPTNECNLKCYFCAREKMNRETKYLSLDTFKKVVDALPSGTYITLTGNGEPLLNKNIYDMVKYASDKEMLVSMITNGTALTEKNSRKLLESGISRVQLSLDSIHKDTYENTRKGARFKDTFLKILKFIYLARSQYNSKIYISVSAVQTEEVKKYSKQSKEFWNNIPIDNYFEAEVLSVQTDSNAYNDLNIDDSEDYNICVTPWIGTKVNADGKVNGCPLDISGKYTIGDINDSNILEILNSNKSIKLRKALYDCDKKYFNEIGYNCHKCNSWRRGVGYGMDDFLEDSIPIRIGLVSSEINQQNQYSTEFLETAIKKLEETGELL